MRYPFTKMQALGNDFVVLDGVSRKVHLSVEQIRRLADRHLGVGCDQVLLVEPADASDDASDDARDNADDNFALRIFNQDGGEVGQCGNGARCVARFLRARGLTHADTIRLRTFARTMTLQLCDDQTVRVDLGAPEFAPKRIPFVAERRAQQYELQLRDGAVQISALSLGNPHAVCQVDDVDAVAIDDVGAQIQRHSRFPERANAGFMQVVARDRIALRVYERGVGETLGCGSGACAAVIAGIVGGQLDSRATVALPGGEVQVEWRGDDSPVFLQGGAHIVFCAEIEI